MRTSRSYFLRKFILIDQKTTRIPVKCCRNHSLKVEPSIALVPFVSISSTSRHGDRKAATPFDAIMKFDPINIKRKSTKFSIISYDTKSFSSSIDKKDYVKDLYRKTSAWLQIPITTWTEHEISKGRFLIREWSKVRDPSSDIVHDNHISSYDGSNKKRAVQQTKILRRWLEARKAKSRKNNGTIGCDDYNPDSHEMVEMLNRCLDSWRQAEKVSRLSTTAASTNARDKHIPQSQSMGLVRLFCDASESLNDKNLCPNQKTYSMCMNVLSMRPDSPTVCEEVLWLLHQCQRTSTPDVQFYHVCMHTLAKCARHHPEAPNFVERVLREMATISNLKPNTECFVATLHAWANSIPPRSSQDIPFRTESEKDKGTSTLAAERAEAILNQMLREFPQMVNTICFNVCIDAWGKQGDPEKAEEILRQLQQFHHRSDREICVRPNQISFNSAINGWAKSASFGIVDPQKAADRARSLFHQMKSQSLEPSPKTFGSLMEAYGNISNPGFRVQSFLDDLEKMYSEGELSHPPPKVCYLMAIRAWGRTKPDGAKRAESLLRRLEDVCLQGGAEWIESEPCTILYTALISAWAQSGTDFAPDYVSSLFWEMDEKARSGRKNISPNEITLNAVVKTFCNHGRIDEARKFLSVAKGVVSPDSKSYMTILTAYAKSNTSDAAEKAQELMWELEDNYLHREGIKPTIRMYSQVLMAWGNSPINDAAHRTEELFWKLLRQEDNNIGVLPDTFAFNCVLRAWSKSLDGGAAERAEKLLSKVQKEHSEEILIDPTSHLHLIYAWAHSGRRKSPREAERHLEQVRLLCNSGKRSDWRMKKAHFNGTILAWKKSNDNNSALNIQKLRAERDAIT